MKTTTIRFALLSLALLGSATVNAQSAGSWLVRASATNINPDVTSGDLSAPSLAGTKTDVGSSTRLGGGITYMYTDHLAVDLPLVLPFKHELTGDGAIAGVGKIGEVKALPMTVFAQYRFGEANAPFRPYVGAGPTYAKFFKERSTATLSALTGGTPANPTTLSVKSKLALSLQVGMSVALSDKWFVDAMVAKTFLKTRNTLSTGQTLDITLDPVSVSLAVGMRF
ncbi:MAG: OmpW/AlkL family protein [Hydrogenophaga sp.]|uniref:OmpW/AlkL family protein n=1 Tax=Hydrogenophaga sp. TaxID=1904254 RepID=UPI003D9B650D